MNETLAHSLSMREVAKYFRVDREKVRRWMKRGVLKAINVGNMGRKQFRFTPGAIKACEEKLAVPVAKPKRKRATDDIDPEVRKFLEES